MFCRSFYRSITDQIRKLYTVLVENAAASYPAQGKLHTTVPGWRPHFDLASTPLEVVKPPEFGDPPF